MGCEIAQRPPRCASNTKTSEWERAAMKTRGPGAEPRPSFSPFLGGELSSEVQHFSRGGKSEALSGSVIEHIHDLGNFLLGDLPEVGTSRKKLTYQAVQVFTEGFCQGEWGRVK